MIFLRRKIEHNWYQGECNGVLGVFPVSHVQVRILTVDSFFDILKISATIDSYLGYDSVT